MSNKINDSIENYNKANNQLWELIALLTKQGILTPEAGNFILDKLKDLKSKLPTTNDFVQDFLSQFKEEQDKQALHTTGKDQKILVRRSDKGEFIIRMYDQNYSNLKLVNV